MDRTIAVLIVTSIILIACIVGLVLSLTSDDKDETPPTDGAPASELATSEGFHQGSRADPFKHSLLPRIASMEAN